MHAQTASTPATSSGGSALDSLAQFFISWDQRALHAQLDQPDWLTPVVTSTARIKQEFRYDIAWQRNPDGSTTENYGGNHGLTSIPVDRLEISINLPPYIVHNQRNVHDGFGDFSILAKFRLLAANRRNGDYAVTAFLATSFPTGSYKNGNPHPVITPTIAAGKGLGGFVYQGTAGVDLPSTGTASTGRRVIQNNAIQYRGLGKIWPEVELNSNFYYGGPNDGKKQSYVTPGISAGRFVIHRNVSLTLAGGVEIALTHFHSSTRQEIFSARFPF